MRVQGKYRSVEPASGDVGCEGKGPRVVQKSLKPDDTDGRTEDVSGYAVAASDGRRGWRGVTGGWYTGKKGKTRGGHGMICASRR